MEAARDRDHRPESISDKIRADVQVWADAWQTSPGAVLLLRLLLLQPGFQLVFSIRLQELAGRIPLVGRAIRRVLWYLTTIWTGSDIDPQATFAGGLFLPHPLCIVIGGSSRIGRNVMILHGVTLGRGERSKACPLIEDGVKINAGAKIIGGVRIGVGAVIGANAVVLIDVPDGRVAVGVPARLVTPRAAAPSSESPT
jgi:serine O-acetyltransferase